MSSSSLLRKLHFAHVEEVKLESNWSIWKNVTATYKTSGPRNWTTSCVLNQCDCLSYPTNAVLECLYFVLI
jgi:hypothetical protein